MNQMVNQVQTQKQWYITFNDKVETQKPQLISTHCTILPTAHTNFHITITTFMTMVRNIEPFVYTYYIFTYFLSVKNKINEGTWKKKSIQFFPYIYILLYSFLIT